MTIERNRWDRVVKIAGWIGIVIMLGFIVFCGVWRAQGGRWERVETPSMGTVAPVGTLLWVKPVAFADLKVGDFITFRPPGKSGTFSHRVYSRNADGTISTKGVIPAPDPWRLTSSDIVGEVRMRWWGVGWIVAAAPILVIGLVLTVAVRSAVSRDWKLPVTVLLGSMAVTVAIVVYRPFINAEQLAFAPDSNGGARATYVGTGLLPIRLTAHDGPSVVMGDGEVGTVQVEKADAQSRLQVGLEPAIPWWWWALLVLSCFGPALFSLVVGFAPGEDEPRHAAQPASA